MARLAESTNQHIIPRIQVDDTTPEADGLGCAPRRVDSRARIAIAGVDDQTEACKSLGLLLDLFDEGRNQILREVVDRAEADVLHIAPAPLPPRAALHLRVDLALRGGPLLHQLELGVEVLVLNGHAGFQRDARVGLPRAQSLNRAVNCIALVGDLLRVMRSSVIQLLQRCFLLGDLLVDGLDRALQLVLALLRLGLQALAGLLILRAREAKRVRHLRDLQKRLP